MKDSSYSTNSFGNKTRLTVLLLSKEKLDGLTFYKYKKWNFLAAVSCCSPILSFLITICT